MIAAYAESPLLSSDFGQFVGDVTAWPQHVETFTSITPCPETGLRLGAQFAVRQPGLPAATWHEVIEPTRAGRSRGRPARPG